MIKISDSNLKKTIIIAIFLILIWGSFFVYLVIYGEDVSKHPCQVCAEKLDEKVMCFKEGLEPLIFDGKIVEELEVSLGD